MINPLAKELNDILSGSVVDALMSDMGKRLYFPNGIISQGGEAAKDAKVANGTIGMAVANGTPIELDSYKKLMPELNPRETVAYAKTAGNPDVRTIWKEKIIEKNPDLKNKKISTPILVPGLTAVLSYVCDLFVDADKPLLAADPSWDNYELIASARRGAEFHQFKCFEKGKFNVPGIEAAMKADAEKYGSVRIILNFPQNPSGYSPTKAETKELCRIVKRFISAVFIHFQRTYDFRNLSIGVKSRKNIIAATQRHKQILLAEKQRRLLKSLIPRNFVKTGQHAVHSAVFAL